MLQLNVDAVALSESESQTFTEHYVGCSSTDNFTQAGRTLTTLAAGDPIRDGESPLEGTTRDRDERSSRTDAGRAREGGCQLQLLSLTGFAPAVGYSLRATEPPPAKLTLGTRRVPLPIAPGVRCCCRPGCAALLTTLEG